MPPKFFITHSSRDNEFARKLTDDLHKHGLDGFFDVYSIKPGENIAARIADGLENCDVYVPILSPAALESPWCKDEINAAITLKNERDENGIVRGRPEIIPIVIAPCILPVLLKPILYINFVGRYDDALNELLNRGFGVSSKPTPPRSLHHSPAAPAQPPPVEKKPATLTKTTPQPPITKPTPVDLDALYLEALEAFHLEKWQIAADALRQVINVKSDYEDAATKLIEAEKNHKQEQLADLYAIAAKAMDAEKWDEAIQKLEVLLT